VAETGGISSGGATASATLSPAANTAKTSTGEVPPSGQPKPQVSQDALSKIKGDATPKPAAEAKPAVDDDPEIETPWGEKLRKSEVARLREVEKNRKKFDAAAHKKFEDTNKRAAELAEREAKIQSAFERMKENPWALHEEAGLNPDDLAEQRLAKALERERLTPEQVELRELKAELERTKKAQADQTEKQKQQRQVAMQEHFVKQYDTEVANALTTLKLPKTVEAAHSVIEEMIRYREAGHDIDTTMAAQIARDRLHDRTRKIVAEITDPDEFAEFIGPEGMALAQQAWLKRADSAPKPAQPPRQRNPQTQKPKQPKTLEQVRKELGIPN